MLDRIEFLLGEALTAFKRNGWMTFAAVSTAAIALFLIGGLGFAYVSIREYMGTLGGRFTMRAYLKDGTSFEGIKEAAAQVRAIPGVGEVNWIPKEKAWEKKKIEQPELAIGLGSSPYPDGLKISIKDLDRSSDIIERIKAIPSVDANEGVLYVDDYLNFLVEGQQVIRFLGIWIGGLCLFTAGVLIYNAIRLTIVARRREIRIMQLVGASYATIRIPFLVEGGLQGAFGGALATGLLFLGHMGLQRMLSNYSALGSLGPFPVWMTLGAMVPVGIAFGMACSALAVRSPLKLGATAP